MKTKSTATLDSTVTVRMNALTGKVEVDRHDDGSADVEYRIGRITISGTLDAWTAQHLGHALLGTEKPKPKPARAKKGAKA